MPGFARFGFDHHVRAIIAQHTNALGRHTQHQRRNVLGQQQIAAATDHQQRHRMCGGIGDGLAHVSITVGLGK
ncbi:hypothetical protein PFLmoz3_05721 [Pseudomonas fluorescens]|uniref:Uncharacterized protein n=1 Tax=Pseudomonas fluorescens TaxID=294 RepID=A0A109LBR4_PSEFL|nr:hypothetical protein PFLmoz3_05721 [Pseudomonas fluorescens]